MDFEFLRNLAIFILILGGLIFVHELGHYLIAVRLGVKVDEFGFGFPPRLAKLGEFNGTEITLNWIPFGGFVRPAGEDDPTVAGGLANAKPWVRLAVLAAGSTFNFILGYMVFTFGFATGWPDAVRVVDIAPDSPAAAANIQTDDLILSVNGDDIHSTSELAGIINRNLGQPITFVLQRDAQTLTYELTPRTEWPEGQGPVGIGMRWEVVAYPLPQALARAGEEVVYIVRETLLLPVRFIAGQTQPGEARIVSPIGLAQISDSAVSASFEQAVLYPVLQLVALVSVALGLTNLLPIPALDGGRIVFVLIEMVRGKPIDIERERWVHAIGMMMLLGLMFLLVIQDIINPISF